MYIYVDIHMIIGWFWTYYLFIALIVIPKIIVHNRPFSSAIKSI